MIASAPLPKTAKKGSRHSTWLENGAHLTAGEFLRRYEAYPGVKKAELINGIVYMGPPVQADQHGEPDALIQGCFVAYWEATNGVRVAANSTTRLGPDDVPQPDSSLRILPEYGGQARLNAKGYVEGPPELVVEIAASTTSLDAREKLATYRRAGIREYLLWRTEGEEIDLFVLDEEECTSLPKSADGTLRSRVFPGLWLDVAALLAGDIPKLMGKLREGLQSTEHAAFVKELQKHAK